MTEKESTQAQETETSGDKVKDGKSKAKKSRRHRQNDGQLNRVRITFPKINLNR